MDITVVPFIITTFISSTISIDLISIPLTTTISISGDATQVAIEPVQFTAQASISAGRSVDIGSIIFRPISISFTATTNPYVYVVDSGNNRIQAFDYDGNFVFSFGSYGSGDGQFNNPYGIDTDEDYLYVTDSGNNRVEVFDLQGVYVGQFGSYGKAFGQFDNPLGIAVDNLWIYVIDNNNNRLEIFAKDYNFVVSYGSYGSGDNQLDNPTDISVDNFYIYIDDTGNDRTVILEKNINIPNYADIYIPSLSVLSDAYCYSITLDNPLPEVKLISHIKPSLSFSASLILPSLILNSNTGVISSFNLPKLNILSNLLFGNSANFSYSLSNLLLESSIKSTYHFSTELSLPNINVISQILYGNNLNASLQLPILTSSTISKSLYTSINLIFHPNLHLVSSLSFINKINSSLNLPQLYIDTLISIPKQIYNEAYILNLNNTSVSKYTNLNANSATISDNILYIASDNGLYKIDNTIPENTEITTGEIDIYKTQYGDLRLIPSEMWVLGNVDTLQLEYYLDSNQPLLYDIIGYNNYETRRKLPRGGRNRVIKFSISNTNKDFSIERIRLIGYKAKGVR